MAEVPLIYIFNYGSIFFFLIFFYTWKFFASNKTKDYNGYKPQAWDTLFTPNLNYLSFFLSWQLFFLFTSKMHKKMYTPAFMNLTLFTLVFTFLIIAYLFFLKKSKVYRLEQEIHVNACVWILFAMMVFVIVDNFVSFLLLLELIATIYFFFVLTFMKSKTLTLIKLKNLVSNYLWISFFTLILIFCSMALLAKDCGTLTFKELYHLNYFTRFFTWQILLISLLWKIGGPGFYFFKLELYQYLPTNSLFFFSITSAFFSCFLLHFMFANCWPIFVHQQFALLIYITIYNIFMLIRGLKSTTFYQFLALSAANTWSVLLMFYLI